MGVERQGTDEENYFFRVTEAIFVGWFTLEYLIRFIVSPYKVGLRCELCSNAPVSINFCIWFALSIQPSVGYPIRACQFYEKCLFDKRVVIKW